MLVCQHLRTRSVDGAGARIPEQAMESMASRPIRCDAAKARYYTEAGVTAGDEFAMYNLALM